MNRLAVLLVLVLSFPLAAHADEATRRAKSEELTTLLHMDRLGKQIMDNILQQTAAITAQRSGGNLSPDTQAALSAFQTKLVALIEPQIGWKVIEPEYVQLYSTTFTDEELDSILAFYKSPAGTALLEKMPGINQQATQLLQSKLSALGPQVKQMVDDFVKSLPPRTPPASAPPTLTPPAAPPAPSAAPAPGKTTPK
jgi:uncharacterized protein